MCVNNFPKVVIWKRNGLESNRRRLSRESNALTIALSGCPDAHKYVCSSYLLPLSSSITFPAPLKLRPFIALYKSVYSLLLPAITAWVTTPEVAELSLPWCTSAERTATLRRSGTMKNPLEYSYSLCRNRHHRLGWLHTHTHTHTHTRSHALILLARVKWEWKEEEGVERAARWSKDEGEYYLSPARYRDLLLFRHNLQLALDNWTRYNATYAFRMNSLRRSCCYLQPVKTKY